MSKVDQSLYQDRKGGSETARVILIFADVADADNFRHERFTARSTTIRMDSGRWAVAGVFDLYFLEDLEGDDSILRVDPDHEVQALPLGDSIEF